MIRDRIRRGLWCLKCGGDHLSSDCERIKSKAPLETPSHNGPYQGTAKVREVPYGIMSPDKDRIHGVYREAAGRASRRSALLNKSICHNPGCKKKVPKNSALHKYCSEDCRREKYRAASRKNYISRRKRSKWG